jgi:hypothetical protein
MHARGSIRASGVGPLLNTVKQNYIAVKLHLSFAINSPEIDFNTPADAKVSGYSSLLHKME